MPRTEKHRTKETEHGPNESTHFYVAKQFLPRMSRCCCCCCCLTLLCKYNQTSHNAMSTPRSRDERPTSKTTPASYIPRCQVESTTPPRFRGFPRAAACLTATQLSISRQLSICTIRIQDAAVQRSNSQRTTFGACLLVTASMQRRKSSRGSRRCCRRDSSFDPCTMRSTSLSTLCRSCAIARTTTTQKSRMVQRVLVSTCSVRVALSADTPQ